MLVLSRRANQQILIGDDIVVTVEAIRRDDAGELYAKLSVTAPRDVAIDRREIRESKLRHGTFAVKSGPAAAVPAGDGVLVLSRRVNQQICIGDEIFVTAQAIRCHADGEPYVRLGFNAPRHVSIDRREIREAKLRDHSAVPTTKEAPCKSTT